MSQLTGDQLVGDVFQANQGTAGAAGPNPDGSYTYETTTTLSQYGGSIKFISGSGENVTAQVVGGTHDGEVYSGTIVANDATDFLVETTQGFVYITNDPAAQPTPPADPNGPPGPDSTRQVAALSPNNSYTYTPPQCFVTGTRIATTRGARSVEDLVVGDRVVVASGETKPIVWIGHRHLECRARPDLQPIHILAHAFGPGLPERDLRLSPGHPVLVGAGEDGEGGHLVPIMCLVNGTTIRREPVDRATYWHVELDSHDVLLAEGLPAESYFDLGTRPWFDGVDGALFDPDMASPDMKGRCRPVAIDGAVVEAERRRLDLLCIVRLERAACWPTETSFGV